MTRLSMQARRLAPLLLALSCVSCSRVPQPAATSSATVPPTTTLTTTALPSTSDSTTESTTDSTTESTTTPQPPIYEPYANTNPALTPTGQTSDGQLQTSDGRTRTYRLYVPASLDASTPAPLLVALHGGLGTSSQFQANSGFDGLAESNGFVVVYPDGIGARADGTGPQTWNGGYCCGPAARAGVDDVGFIRQLIDRLEAERSIDSSRIFVAGHSNGAIMAYRLACELSDRIAAIGVQAGSLGVDTCAPARAVSVIHLHGTADTNHPIDGGVGSGVSGVAFRPARDAVEALAAADGCSPTPMPSLDPTNPDLAVTTWAQCREAATVRYVVVDGATHAWMGRPALSELASSFVGEPYPNLDASRAIWSFLASHPRR
ncbi:MAG: alpha/beta hydrolase family esterase [Ilumatobacteraceae bacterium]